MNEYPKHLSPRQLRQLPPEERWRVLRQQKAESRAWFAEQDRKAWEAADNRPADWIVPNGETEQGKGWIRSPGPCGDSCYPEGACGDGYHSVSGLWVPNRRDSSATCYTFVPNAIPTESDEHRTWPDPEN